jgi:hypothetical protein
MLNEVTFNNNYLGKISAVPSNNKNFAINQENYYNSYMKNLVTNHSPQGPNIYAKDSESSRLGTDGNFSQKCETVNLDG